jgi:hypothetical protein
MRRGSTAEEYLRGLDVRGGFRSFEQRLAELHCTSAIRDDSRLDDIKQRTISFATTSHHDALVQC